MVLLLHMRGRARPLPNGSATATDDFNRVVGGIPIARHRPAGAGGEEDDSVGREGALRSYEECERRSDKGKEQEGGEELLEIAPRCGGGHMLEL